MFERTWNAVTIARVWHSSWLAFHAGKRSRYSRLDGSLSNGRPPRRSSASVAPQSSQSYSRRPEGTSRTWTSLCLDQHNKSPRGRKFSFYRRRSSPMLKDDARTSSARLATRPRFSDTWSCRGMRGTWSWPCSDQPDFNMDYRTRLTGKGGATCTTYSFRAHSLI